MDEKKSWFWRELEEGYIHVRDKLQFELKSEFITKEGKKTSVYLQELYFFIPESLLISPQTYSHEQFYLDETNFIRTKTPLFTLKDLNDADNAKSPFSKIERLLNEDKNGLVHELKMLANMFKSTLREEVKEIVESTTHTPYPVFEKRVEEFCAAVRQTRREFRSLRRKLKDRLVNEPAIEASILVEEYLGLVIDNYLTGMIDLLRHQGLEIGTPLDETLCDLTLDEGIHPSSNEEEEGNEEKVLQRGSYLNKYFYEALYLKNVRVELKKKHGALIGMAAAGAAMSVYMVLFVWKATTFGINSLPFVIFAVFFYVLKDRVKEGMKDLYHKNAYRWFPDFSTEIQSPKGLPVGTLNESFQFVETVPEDFAAFRKADLEENHTPETIMQYKKEIILKTENPVQLNTIFRFNIHRFLEKAADSIQVRHRLNPQTREIEEEMLPKVYYLTLLLKNSFQNSSEIKKFRVSIHKQGIEKVQYIGSRFE